MTPNEIARIAHEVNRAYCQALGDFSHVPWEEAPADQKESAMLGVKFHTENPEAGPRASHDSWLYHKLATGWTYGPVKRQDLLRHPCICSFEDLPVEQQAKDFIFCAVVRSLHTYHQAG